MNVRQNTMFSKSLWIQRSFNWHICLFIRFLSILFKDGWKLVPNSRKRIHNPNLHQVVNLQICSSEMSRLLLYWHCAKIYSDREWRYQLKFIWLIIVTVMLAFSMLASTPLVLGMDKNYQSCICIYQIPPNY